MDEQNQISIQPKQVDHTVNVSTGTRAGSESAPQDKPADTEQPQPEAPKADERLEALERREKALYKKMQEVKAQEEALQKNQSNSLTAEQWKEKFLEDPTALGIGYEDMAQRYLDQPTPEQQTIIELKREIEELKTGQSSLLDEFKQRDTQSYENAKKQISAEVGRLVENNADYAVIKAAQAQDAVTQYIEKVYHEEGVLLSTAEAAADVKEHILEQHNAIASLLAPNEQQTRQTPKTLSHSMTQQTTRQLSRRERAILVAQGRKNELPEYQKS